MKCVVWNSSRASLDELRGTTKDSFRITSMPARRNWSLERTECMPVPFPGWVVKWQNFELKSFGVSRYVERRPTARCVVLENTAEKLRTFYEIRRLFVVMTRNLSLLTLQICIQDMPSSNLASEEETVYTETSIVCIRCIMLHFKTQLCGRILCSNVGKYGKFRLGNTYCRCCENDLTWGNVKLK